MDERESVQVIVDRREATGLGWSIIARLIFLVLAFVSVFTMSVSWEYRLYETFVFLAGTALALKGLREVREVRRLTKVAMILASFDLFILVTLPISWYAAVGGLSTSPAFLLKNELFLVAVILIVVNTLSLRPLYPSLVGWGSVLVHVVLFVLVVFDGRVEWTFSPAEAFQTEAVHPAIYVLRTITLGLAGWFLSVLAYSARRTLREAVEAQVAEGEARRQQAEAILQGRMEALTSLVAGIAHEVNTPLGALSSSAETQGRVADRLRATGAPAPLVEAMESSAKTIRDAGERIRQIVRRLRSFARLDQAEIAKAFLPEEIRNVVKLIPESKREGVDLRITAPADLAPLSCRVRALNQVFHTLLENAFDALDGRGHLEIAIEPSPGGLAVRFADDGPGIPDETLARLFEPRIDRSRRRVGMGLGLPAAKRIVEDHGGTIEVRTEVGRGTTVNLFIPPLAAAAAPTTSVEAPSARTA